MTLREIGIKLGFDLDKSKQAKAEKAIDGTKRKLSGVEKGLKKAFKAFTVIAITKKIVSLVKDMEAVKNATDEVKKRWGEAFQELDKVTGFSKQIAEWIKQISDKALALFRKIMPQVQQLIQRLGGTQNALKLVGVAAGSIMLALNANKIMSGIKSITGLLRPQTLIWGAIAAAVLLVFLLVDDFVSFLKGKNSLFGKTWEPLKKALEGLKKVFGDVKGKFKATLGKIGDGVKRFMTTTLPKILPAIVSAASGILNAISWVIDKLSVLKAKTTEWWENGGKEKFEDAKGKVLAVANVVKDLVMAVGGGLKYAWDKAKAAGEWIGEHKKTLGTIAGIIGSITAAILLWNGAMAAGKAIQIAFAAAQKLANGFSLKDIALKGIQIIKQTVLNAVMLANPIGLIILAVLALIAIVVLLWKNWDKVKEVFLKVWEKIKAVWGKAKDWFKQKVIDPIVKFFTGIKDKVVGVFNSVVDWFKTNWQSILLFLINPFAGIFKYLYDNNEKFREWVDGVIQKIKGGFGTVKDWFKNKVIDPIANFFKKLWGDIIGGVEKVKGWLSKLNPKNWFSGKATITGEVESGGEKKMASGGLLRGPTRLLGGEYPGASSNPEVVSPLSTLRGMMTDDFKQALRSFMGDMNAVMDFARPQPALAMAGMGGVTINQSFQQSFTCTDRNMQEKTDRAMGNSVKDTTSALARGIKYQR